MRDPELEEPLTDAALDREIERVTTVEPSPHFVHRVRARIAAADAAPRTAAWRPAWAAAGAAVAGIVGLYLAGPFEPDRPADAGHRVAVPRAADRNLAGVVAETPELRPARAAGGTVSPPAAAAGHSRERNTTAVAVDEPAIFTPVLSRELVLPPVLIAADERRALELMLVLRPIPDAERQNAQTEQVLPALPPIAEIEVPELEIAPLAQIVTLEGGRP
jgi:hypothetical protein